MNVKNSFLIGTIVGITVFGLAYLVGELEGSLIGSIEGELDYIALNKGNIERVKNSENLNPRQKEELISIYESCISDSREHLMNLKSSYPILWRRLGYDEDLRTMEDEN